MSSTRLKITDVEVRDVRFPTSRKLDGSDAMHVDPDYSATYVILRTDSAERFEGHGLTFTIGRGNEVCVAAAHALAPLVVGQSLESITLDFGLYWRSLTSDSQLRWIGPEKGAIHLATGAVVNALWDLWAKVVDKPLWKLLADLSPEQLVRCVDFRYIRDLVDERRAFELLCRRRDGRAEREAEMRERGYPAYTTSTGWSGYADDKVRALCRGALEQGWTHFKVKVGASPEQDQHRVGLVREVIGDERVLMLDANQRWGVDEAIARAAELARFDPLWIEEPTSPDDVLGHARIAAAVAPIGVATGEMCQNRVIFKQLLQADAIGYCQVDACRLGGVNEVLAVLLMAAERGVPVCPHAGGVGLCEYVQHLALFDYIGVSGSLEGRVVEYVDHLHEHFVDPVQIRDARYQTPLGAGYSIAILPASLERYRYPHGAAWR